jgi:hypothetical protein
MSRGAIIFAHNNHEVDYGRIAIVNALMIRYNLNVGTTLITDRGTYDWIVKSNPDLDIDNIFENIICDGYNKHTESATSRLYRDTSYTAKTLPFYNTNHWQAYDLSPYDETLFIDADYLVMSGDLNKVWGSSYDLLINKDVKEVLSTRDMAEKRISDTGIDMYWATVVYFKKTHYASLVFSLVHHIFENYTYYRQLYSVKGNMFRNDYAFSIALHTLNGFANVLPNPQLPVTSLVKSFDTDDFHSVNGINDITLLTEKPGYTGEYTLTRIKDIDVHIMNKWSILRHYDSLIQAYYYAD